MEKQQEVAKLNFFDLPEFYKHVTHHYHISWLRSSGYAIHFALYMMKHPLFHVFDRLHPDNRKTVSRETYVQLITEPWVDQVMETVNRLEQEAHER